MSTDHAAAQTLRRSAFKNKHSTYERDPLDFYVEPRWTTGLLLEALPGCEKVWDPACGSGNIIVGCWNFGVDAFGTDIVQRSPGQLGVMDFLDPCTHGYKFTDIITNPPYSLAEAFIRRAHELRARRIAVLVRLDFLASQRRHALFTEMPPSYVLVLSRRPSMPPGPITADTKAKNGQHDYMWLVWDTFRPKWPTEVRWLK